MGLSGCMLWSKFYGGGSGRLIQHRFFEEALYGLGKDPMKMAGRKENIASDRICLVYYLIL